MAFLVLRAVLDIRRFWITEFKTLCIFKRQKGKGRTLNIIKRNGSLYNKEFFAGYSIYGTAWDISNISYGTESPWLSRDKKQKEYPLILCLVTSGLQFSLQLWNTEEVNNLMTQIPASQFLARHIKISLTKAIQCLLLISG